MYSYIISAYPPAAWVLGSKFASNDNFIYSKIFPSNSLTLYQIIPKIYSKIVGIVASSVTNFSISLSSLFSKYSKSFSNISSENLSSIKLLNLLYLSSWIYLFASFGLVISILKSLLKSE